MYSFVFMKEQVFKRLQIVQRANETDIELTANEDDNYEIDFYVYKKSHDHKFKKKSPGEPLFRVVVTRLTSFGIFSF